jgi:hypothetical protein
MSFVTGSIKDVAEFYGTVANSEKLSVTLYDNSTDPITAALIRAVLRKIKTNSSFISSYTDEVYMVDNQVKSYYDYVSSGSYVHGLPTMEVAGKRFDAATESAVVSAILSSTGITATIIEGSSGYLEPIRHFKNSLQSTHQYLPHNNTLTHTDVYGVSWSDWTLVEPIVYNSGTPDYTIYVTRPADTAELWIEGPVMIAEANDAVFTVKSSKVVPAGQSLVINLTYSGTAVDGVDYTEVASVTMAESTDEVDVTIATVSIDGGDPSLAFTITLDSVPNTGGVFEHVVIDSPVSVTCTIASDGTTIPTQDAPDAHVQSTYHINSSIVGADYVSGRHLIAKYHESAAPESEWFYWVYRYEDGTYPSINPLSNTINNPEMLPVAVIREDSVFCDVDKALPLYLTTKALMAKLPLSLDGVIGSLSGDPGGDLSNLTDSYLNFSVAPSDTNEVVSKLLYKILYEIIVTNGLSSDSGEYTSSFTEGDITSAMAWVDHTYTTGIVGNVAAEGKYTHSVTPVYGTDSGIPSTAGTPTTPSTPARPSNTSTVVGNVLLIRYQDTSTSYSEITATNLMSSTTIEYSGYKKTVMCSLWDSDNSEVDKSFTVPLSWYLFYSLDVEDQIRSYVYVLRLDLYATTTADLSWYKTEQFESSLLDVATQNATTNVVSLEPEATSSAVLSAVVRMITNDNILGSDNFGFSDLINPVDFTELSTEFTNNVSTASAATLEKTVEKWVDEGMTVQDAQDKLDKKIESEVSSNLKSLDAQLVIAIDSQYQFDETFGYGKVGNYHDTQLVTGII